MPIFEYNALTQSGRAMTGSLEASDHDQAAQLLQEMQLTVNEITESKQKPPKTPIARSEFLLFNQQLASIAKAGIPLEKGLRQLAGDMASSKMRKLVNEIADELENGISIETAIEKRQKLFPPLYGHILKAGVQSGRLSEMLTSLNLHLETTNRTRRIIFEALCYPAVVLTITAVIITFVFILVIPPFAEVLGDMADGSAGLPVLTNFFIMMAKHVTTFWMGVFLLAAAIFFVYILLSSSPAGRRVKESFFTWLPILGRLYRSTVLAKLAQTMALLVNAGCDMPTCLRLSAGASGSENTKLECEIIASQIEKGTNILQASQFCKMIPGLFMYSVQLGSQRNELADNLHSLTQMYDSQTRTLQGRLQAVLLPVMIIFVGLFIGTMVLAMFLPMVRVITVLM